jgi:hypothetical protein
MTILAALALPGPFATRAALAQAPRPGELRATVDAAAQAAIGAQLELAFRRLEAEGREPERDDARYRTDPAYRRSYREALERTEERRKQLALRFLDRFGAALDEGVGLYYHGLALKLAGDLREAAGKLTEFRIAEPGHPRSNDALLLIIECLLEEQSDLATDSGLREEKLRQGRLRTFLRRLDREQDKLTTAQRQTESELRRRFALAATRVAYHDMLGAMEKARRDVLLADADPRLREFLEKNEEVLKRLTVRPDEEQYNDSVSLRDAYWRIQRNHDRLLRERRQAVKRFYREHREALEKGEGLLWMARAFALAADVRRAAATYARFREAEPDHPEATRAALEQAHLLVIEAHDPEAAERALATLDTSALSEEEKVRLHALRDRIRSVREQQRTLEAWQGRPLREIPVVEAIGDPPPLSASGLGGRPSVLLFFAAWSEPGRALLAAAAEAQQGLPPESVRFVAVTRFFGFGWEVSRPDDRTLAGRPAGPDLAPAEELRLAAALTRAAGLDAALVFTAPEALASIPAFPAVVLVDARGVVRFAATGREAAAKVIGLAGR